MSIYLRLFYVFFKLGMFGFGGGYAIVSLMKEELEANHWLNLEEFGNIVSISQMTPGPIGINAATYVGYNVAPSGLIGSLCATFGIVAPSFILIIIVAKIFNKFKDDVVFNSILNGIRPVTIGLIASAVVFFANLSIISFSSQSLYSTLPLLYTFFNKIQIHFGALLIAVIIFISRKYLNIHPILAVFVSAILGIILI